MAHRSTASGRPGLAPVILSIRHRPPLADQIMPATAAGTALFRRCFFFRLLLLFFSISKIGDGAGLAGPHKFLGD